MLFLVHKMEFLEAKTRLLVIKITWREIITKLPEIKMESGAATTRLWVTLTTSRELKTIFRAPGTPCRETPTEFQEIKIRSLEMEMVWTEILMGF